jgi:exopolysaccharide production protein ExoQ
MTARASALPADGVPSIILPRQKVAAEHQKRDWLGWILCTASFVLLEFVTWSTRIASGATTIAVFLFLLPWALIVLRQPRAAAASILRNWIILALPVWMLLSVVWSSQPDISLKSGAEFLGTVMIGILAASCIQPAVTISALFSALFLIFIFGSLLALHGGQGYIYGFIILFGSKNFFAQYVSCLLLTAVAVILDGTQRTLLRRCALVLAVFCPLLLIYANSLDALVSTGAALIFTLFMWLTTRVKPVLRAAILTIALLVLILIPIIATIEVNFADVLGHFGKDVTLTGRTELWDNAKIAIAERPILGNGYQAYWIPGNWRAEQLWLFAGLHDKTGYHFHNTYLEVLVDLGYVGLFIFLTPVVMIAGRAIGSLVFWKPEPYQIFAISVFIFLFLRTPLEVDLLFPFQLPVILFSLCWVYLGRRRRSTPRNLAFGA